MWLAVTERLVWIDCEMTGLDLTADALIEVAALVTDFDLNVLGDGIDIIIKPSAEALEQMGDYVRTMHEDSGLLAELDAGTTLADAEALYIRDGDGYVGTILTQGGWDPNVANGGTVLALLGHCLDEVPTLVPMTLSRFTADLHRPVPMGRRLHVVPTIVREGKKIQVVELRLLDGDVEHVRVTALRLRDEQIGEVAGRHDRLPSRRRAAPAGVRPPPARAHAERARVPPRRRHATSAHRRRHRGRRVAAALRPGAARRADQPLSPARRPRGLRQPHRHGRPPRTRVA